MTMSQNELVELFCSKATVVGAQVHCVAHMDAALELLIDICEKKPPCELLMDAEGTEHGPLSERGLPTRTNRIIAAPELEAGLYAKLAAACEAKGIVCLEKGTRDYLAGLDIGFAVADLGIAASATCMVNSDSEEKRIATVMCEYCVLVLKKSDIYPDLPSIAPALRALQARETPSYTSFMSGPSRTADIERIPAVGVHGALEQHIILLED